jgi:hypothetical protein
MEHKSCVPKKLDSFQNFTPAFLCSSACISSLSAGPCDACFKGVANHPHVHVHRDVSIRRVNECRLNTCGCPAQAVSAPPRSARKHRPREGPAAMLESPCPRPGARDPGKCSDSAKVPRLAAASRMPQAQRRTAAGSMALLHVVSRCGQRSDLSLHCLAALTS